VIKNLGRPRAIDETKIAKLVKYLSQGNSVVMACRQARISTSTFYTELASNEEFSDIVHAAEGVMDAMATQLVYRSLSRGSLDTAKWWLQRQDHREANAQRMRAQRQRKRLSVKEIHQKTTGSRVVVEPASQKPVSFEKYKTTSHTIAVDGEQMA